MNLFIFEWLKSLGEPNMTPEERFERLRDVHWPTFRKLALIGLGVFAVFGLLAVGKDMGNKKETCIPMARFEAIVKDGAWIPLITGDGIHTGKAIETWISPEKKAMVVTYTRIPNAHPDTVCLTEGLKDVSIDPDTVKTLMKVMEKQGGNPT